MTAWGYPVQVRGLLDTRFTRRNTSGALKVLLNDSLRNQVTLAGTPSLNLSVDFLDSGHLLPGHSGAPLLDGAGRVVAIADGGLERGGVEINWAIPAQLLTQLEKSSESPDFTPPHADILFAADLVEESDLAQFSVDVDTLDTSRPELISVTGVSYTCGSARFVKVRTRTLEVLQQAADDPRGLLQLRSISGILVTQSDSFDVYQDLTSGATAVTPAGVAWTPGPSGCWVASPSGHVTQFVSIAPAPNPMAIQSISLQFEQRVFAAIGGGLPQVDPNWTQITPIVRSDGGIVRRGAYILPQFASTKYMFETLASKNGTFMGVATVRHDFTPMRFQMQQACLNGAQGPLCPELMEDVRWQAMMTLATHLSMFPFA
jgi:hypothetical protein